MTLDAKEKNNEKITLRQKNLMYAIEMSKLLEQNER